MALLSALVLLVGAAQDFGSRQPSLLQEPKQEEKKQDGPPAPAEPAPQAEDPSFIDFGRLELFPHLGLALYSNDFNADPDFCGGISSRAPLPWLSRGLLGLETDRIGAFLDLTVSSIRRELGTGSEDDSGALLFVSLGADVALLESESFKAAFQIGLQYAHLRSVTDLDGGVGLHLGVSASIPFTERLSIGINPTLSLGSGGDHLWLIHFGLVYGF